MEEGQRGMLFLHLTKLVDQEPVNIRVDQVLRVHGRRGQAGKLFAEIHLEGGRKPIGVVERFDQVQAMLEAAGAKMIGASDRGSAVAKTNAETDTH